MPSWTRSRRGRRGRVWHSALGDSLTFSLLWRFQRGAAGLSGLSLAVGVALVRALHALGVPEARIKWPNDVLIGGNKLAGILIELQGDMESASAAVIGVGINMRLPQHMKDSIAQPAIGLDEMLPGADPNHVLGMVLDHMFNAVTEFDRAGFTSLRPEWMAAHAHQGQPVRLLLPNGGEIEGTAAGVDDNGVLVVATAEGEKRFASGEVSLRGMAA